MLTTIQKMKHQICTAYGLFSVVVLAVVLAVVLQTGCQKKSENEMLFGKKQNNEQSDLVDVALKEVGEGKSVLLDVRTQEEWDGGHFKLATHWALADIQATSSADEISHLKQGTKIYIHCAKGVRATYASDHLNQLGYDTEPLTLTFERLHQLGFELDN